MLSCWQLSCLAVVASRALLRSNLHRREGNCFVALLLATTCGGGGDCFPGPNARAGVALLLATTCGDGGDCFTGPNARAGVALLLATTCGGGGDCFPGPNARTGVAPLLAPTCGFGVVASRALLRSNLHHREGDCFVALLLATTPSRECRTGPPIRDSGSGSSPPSSAATLL